MLYDPVGQPADNVTLTLGGLGGVDSKLEGTVTIDGKIMTDGTSASLKVLSSTAVEFSIYGN